MPRTRACSGTGTGSPGWGAAPASIPLRAVVQRPDEAAAAQARRNLTVVVQRIRTNAETKVVIADGRSSREILKESSADADLVFKGMAEPSDPEAFSRSYVRLQG